MKIFFHLIGLHKTNIDMFFPKYIKTKARKYSFIKKNLKKFNGIVENQIKEKNTLTLRIKSFPNILDLLKSNQGISLFDLKIVPIGSQFKGDFGILKVYENLSCLLALKCDYEADLTINCAPQSWMADRRSIQLTEFKKPIYMENISNVPITAYNSEFNEIAS